MTSDGATSQKLGKASAARREGRLDEARSLLEEVLAEVPNLGPALNLAGLVALSQGDPRASIEFLRKAAAADPKMPLIWMNLAEAHRANQDPTAEIEALDGALAIDPYLLPALLKKAQAFERSDNLGESAKLYRTLLAITPDVNALPRPVQDALVHGQSVVATLATAQLRAMDHPLEEVERRFPDADLRRARAYAEHLAGRRKVYLQQPVDAHFPYLPALEFFPPEYFPWFRMLEAATEAIRGDLGRLLAEDAAGFRPYVAFDRTVPANQWAELNHSPRWSAWFLWKDGVRQNANCERCAATAGIVDSLPLLDIRGKAPSVMFSVLEPRTRIPVHNGSSNVRATVHLPLVVPDGCGFRVGAETRAWQEGTAWAFDDTIEHEAWNDSDQPRTILILDVWNPLLSEAERAAVRAVT